MCNILYDIWHQRHASRLLVHHLDDYICQVLLVWNHAYPLSSILHLMTLFQRSGCRESGPRWQRLPQNRQCVWKSKMDKVELHARFSGGVVVLDWSRSFDFEMLRLINFWRIYWHTWLVIYYGVVIVLSQLFLKINVNTITPTFLDLILFYVRTRPDVIRELLQSLSRNHLWELKKHADIVINYTTTTTH